VFAATLALALARPRGIHEAVFTVAGAAVMLAIGAVHAGDLRAIDAAGRGAILFLAALLILSALVDRSGLFEWAALHAARAARGSGRVLFRNVFVLGAIVTATLSLDTTAVLLTPIVLSFVRRLGVSARPYVIACAFVANAGSLALPVSNLTNLIFAGAFHLAFARFVLVMAPVQIAVLAITYAALRAHFASDLGSFDVAALPADPAEVVPHRGYFLTTTAVLAAALAGYGVAPVFAVEPYAVAFGASAVLLVAGVATGRVGRAVVGEISWGVVPFVLGLFVVVQALDNLGLASALARFIAGAPGGAVGRALATTGAAAVASNAMNNLPAALVARAALAQTAGVGAAGSPGPMLVYATLVGTNVGPNVVPFGSLATVLVLTLARRSGVHVSAGSFARAGLWATPLACAVASVAVALVAR
jgi:arsenical pump membrane protein